MRIETMARYLIIDKEKPEYMGEQIINVNGEYYAILSPEETEAKWKDLFSLSYGLGFIACTRKNEEYDWSQFKQSL